MANNSTLPHPQVEVRAMFAPGTVNTEARTVELVWSKGAQVQRSSWDRGSYIEELSMAPGHVRLDRLNKGAPLLDSHDAFSLRSQIGVVERAWIAGNEGRAVVRFSAREDVEPIFQDVVAGIYRNVSVGYRVHKTERDEAGEIPVERAVDWEPYELSLVTIPADAGAQVRSQNIKNIGGNMSTETISNTDNLDIRAEERRRTTGILDCARKLQVSEALAHQLIADGVALDDARMQLIDARSAEERKTPGVARTEVGHGHSRLAPLEDGLLKRLQQQAGGISLLRVMEDLTGRRGSSDELLQRAMSTSDFPALFAGAGARFMREMYNAAGVGARLIAKGRQSSDLRDINLLGLSEFPGLLKLGEGGEIKYGNFTDRGGSYRVEEFARGVRLTRRAMLTDDLDAFSEALASYGRAIAALEDQLVIDALETGATGAKSMEDGKALFHADHQNSTTATALGISSLGEATRRLRGMKETGNGRALNLTPRWVLVPATHEVQALQLCTAINATESSAVNPFGAGSLALEPIVDANLGGSYAYVLADPAGPAAAIELCTGPAVADVQTQSDFDTTSLKTRVLADRGLGVRDHRGIVRIPLGS